MPPKKSKHFRPIGEAKGELGDLKVTVKLDKAAGTITIADNGVGMTAEEVENTSTRSLFRVPKNLYRNTRDKMKMPSSVNLV